jgi:hypothetical protein
LIDHSSKADKAGLQMRPTKLPILGSPKAGTPLMIGAPTITARLPLKRWTGRMPTARHRPHTILLHVSKRGGGLGPEYCRRKSNSEERRRMNRSSECRRNVARN